MSVTVRDARAGDGVRLAAMWREHAAYYAEQFPADFVVPREQGLAEWFEADLARERSPETRWLVAEVEGETAGYLWEERAGYARRGITFAKRLV
jgi:hypothetical protein